MTVSAFSFNTSKKNKLTSPSVLKLQSIVPNVQRASPVATIVHDIALLFITIRKRLGNLELMHPPMVKDKGKTVALVRIFPVWIYTRWFEKGNLAIRLSRLLHSVSFLLPCSPLSTLLLLPQGFVFTFSLLIDMTPFLHFYFLFFSVSPLAFTQILLYVLPAHTNGFQSQFFRVRSVHTRYRVHEIRHRFAWVNFGLFRAINVNQQR